jgi:hypothetical protein
MPEATRAHIDDLIAKLREAADQLENVKGDDVNKMVAASMEIQSCCGDCLLVTGVPCATCIQVSPLA